MSDAKLLISRDGLDPGAQKCAVISRRNFLSFLAPLPLLPVVGPHMLLSEKPTRLGWTPGRTDQVPLDVERWINSHGAGFNWKTIAERMLLERDLKREVAFRLVHPTPVKSPHR